MSKTYPEYYATTDNTCNSYSDDHLERFNTSLDSYLEALENDDPERHDLDWYLGQSSKSFSDRYLTGDPRRLPAIA